MFTGIAYAAAFADCFTAQAMLGMHELEASTAAPGALLRTARVLGAFSVVIAPSLAVLLVMGLVQTISGHPWSLPGALAVTATVVAPAALIAMALSDRKSTRLNSSHVAISYAVFCLKKKNNCSTSLIVLHYSVVPRVLH